MRLFVLSLFLSCCVEKSSYIIRGSVGLMSKNRSTNV